MNILPLTAIGTCIPAVFFMLVAIREEAGLTRFLRLHPLRSAVSVAALMEQRARQPPIKTYAQSGRRLLSAAVARGIGAASAKMAA